MRTEVPDRQANAVWLMLAVVGLMLAIAGWLRWAGW
jgi:hypothetical protein